jgi:hypothetical protein
MGQHDQYKPSKDEFLITGLFGSALYIFLATIILYAYLKNPKNKFSKYFFILMFFVCLFEIPRFLSIALTTDYQSKSFYILHIFTSILFFGSFTLVCLQWSTLLRLGTYIRIIYSFKGVLISNILFALFDLIAMILCATSSSLQTYFRSTFFQWFTFVDTFKNLFYSSLLFFYGLKLIIKFYKYNSLEMSYNLFQSDLPPPPLSSSATSTPSIPSATSTNRKELGYTTTNNYGQRKTAFGIALKKLIIVLFLVTLCFLVRVMMLIVKVIALQGDRLVSSPTVPLFGFIWFTLSDWIPRCLPSFAFVYLMNIKRGTVRRGGGGAGGTTEGLLKGDFLRQSSGDGGFGRSGDDYDDDEDDLSSFNDYQEGEGYFDEDEYGEDYLTESRYSDDQALHPTYSNQPYAWSEGSEDNVYAGEDDGDDQVTHHLNPRHDLEKGGAATSSKNSSSSSKLSFFTRNHYSWTALSSGLSFTNLTSSKTHSNSTISPHENLTSSSSFTQFVNPVSVENDDISMTGFTSLTQLTPSRRGAGGGTSGRISPQQKNDGYNNIEPLGRGGSRGGAQKRTVEL